MTLVVRGFTNRKSNRKYLERSFIMTHEIKPENTIQCTGKVMFKNFNNETKSLFIVVGIFTPKLIWGKLDSNNESKSDNFNRDFPAFVMSGEKAIEVNREVNEGDIVSLRGHIETVSIMRPTGGNNFHREFRIRLIADDIFLDNSKNGFCSVSLGGDVIRVYRNEDHNLYIVTVRIDMENESSSRASFVYFDRNMKLEPKVGDHVNMSGIIQTKRMPAQEGRRAQTLLSIVARYVVLDRI